MTRRTFAAQLGAAVASLLLLPAMFCNKANDLIQSLRGILGAVEHALSLLGALQGLLPAVVNDAAKYLLSVVSFVDSTGQILENDGLQAADKVRQILALAAGLVVPVIPNATVQGILTAVAAAVDKFLSHFGATATNARSVPVSSVPNLEFNQKQRQELEQIEQDSRKDKVAIEDWQKRALAQPH